MKYAIAVIGGAQVKLEEGKTYKFDRFDGQITNVVFYKDDEVEKALSESAFCDDCWFRILKILKERGLDK